MTSTNMIQVNGVIRNITQITEDCSTLMIAMDAPTGIINMLLTAETYVVDCIRLQIGMCIAAFYNGNDPVPLIYPPQYRSYIIAPLSGEDEVTLRFFDESLTASDQSLQLNISPDTPILTINGQAYSCSPENKNLLVFYSITTRSIPPQTPPDRIIVMNQ